MSEALATTISTPETTQTPGVPMSAFEGDEMSEAFENEQHRRNLELLEGTEGGKIVRDAYLAAVAEAPELAGVSLIDSNDPAHADRPKIANRFCILWGGTTSSGVTEVYVPLGGGDVMNDIEKLYESPPGQVIREQIGGMRWRGGQDTGEVNPRHIYAFAILHELGHAVQFSRYEQAGRDPAEIMRQNKSEQSFRTLGNISLSDLRDPDSKATANALDYWARMQVKLEFSIDNILIERSREYRSLSAERFADGFAADILSGAPGLYEELGRGLQESEDGLHAAA